MHHFNKNYGVKQLLIITISFKILISLYFSSGYQEHIFLPFVDYFITNVSNPWAYFFHYDQRISFPYPPLLLYILSPCLFFIKLFGLTSSTIITNLALKIPNIVADITIYYILNKLLPLKKSEVLIFYFLSPIVFYVSYIQGQLDLIPVAFLLCSVYLVFRNKLFFSAMLFAGAILCKSTAIFALPLILLFILKYRKYPNILVYLLAVALIYGIISCPFILSPEYRWFVFDNKEMSLIFDFSFNVFTLKMFPLIIILVLCYAKFYSHKKVNPALLLSYLNFIFAVFLIFAYPIPSWFIWIIPYLVWFIISYRAHNPIIIALYVLFCITYLVYFIGFYHHPFNNLSDIILLGKSLGLPIMNSNTTLANLSFSVIVAIVFTLAYFIHLIAKKSNELYSINHTTIIGISGDSGAGKSILLEDIRSIVGMDKITHLEGDGEHKWERGHQKWQEHTHLDPKANYLHKQADYIEDLKLGKKILRRDYNHDTGEFTQAKPIYARDFIAIAGLHTFYLPKARKLIDAKIFVDTDERLRQHWKIIRDKKKRGYTKEEVLNNLAKRQADRERYIIPQQSFADCIFRYFPNIDFELGDDNEDILINLQVNIPASIDSTKIEQLLVSVSTIEFSFDYSSDLKTQEWIFSGDITSNEINKLAEMMIINLDEIVINKPIWQSGMRGLRQFFSILVLSHVMKERYNGGI